MLEEHRSLQIDKSYKGLSSVVRDEFKSIANAFEANLDTATNGVNALGLVIGVVREWDRRRMAHTDAMDKDYEGTRIRIAGKHVTPEELRSHLHERSGAILTNRLEPG